MESWINEKLQTAAEASYREASNLQIKLQKHETFEAEITANKGQLDNIIKDGDALLKTFPGHREIVEKRRKDLTDLWKLLQDLSANKALRLKEAIQKQTFDRNVTELETWMDEISGSLSSKEFGRDLRSAGNLMKKHQQMEEDILNHEDRVNEILEQATAFEEAGHFQKEEITERAADVAERSVDRFKCFTSINVSAYFNYDNHHQFTLQHSTQKYDQFSLVLSHACVPIILGYVMHNLFMWQFKD